MDHALTTLRGPFNLGRTRLDDVVQYRCIVVD